MLIRVPQKKCGRLISTRLFTTKEGVTVLSTAIHGGGQFSGFAQSIAPAWSRYAGAGRCRRGSSRQDRCMNLRADSEG